MTIAELSAVVSGLIGLVKAIAPLVRKHSQLNLTEVDEELQAIQATLDRWDQALKLGKAHRDQVP